MSPWPPMTNAVTSSAETLNSSARKCRKRAEFEHTRHADDLVLGQAGELLQCPDHGVERVGDADHERIRRIFADAFADGFHDLEVDAQQIVTAHAGLAWHAGGHDADIRAFDGSVVAGAGETGILAENRRGLGNVQRLALGGAFIEVQQNHVAKLFARRNMGECSADHSRSDECDFLAGHKGSPASV